MKKIWKAAAIGAAALGLSVSVASAQSVLQKTKERGQVVCGTGLGIAGFGMPDE